MIPTYLGHAQFGISTAQVLAQVIVETNAAASTVRSIERRVYVAAEMRPERARQPGDGHAALVDSDANEVDALNA